MTEILSPEVIEEAIADLRREAVRVHEMRSSLNSQIDSLYWQGRGRLHFEAQLRGHLWRLNRRETDLEESAKVLAGVAEAAHNARRNLERQADEVRAAAIASGDEAAFLAAHGLTEYPPKGDVAWRGLWRALYTTDRLKLADS